MYDVVLIKEILRQIHWSTETILRRFQPVNAPTDFTSSDAGMEKLDAMCMQLIAIGESLKNLDKVTNGLLLPQYPNIEWKRIMGMRDILSHHYFDVDADIVFNVCVQYIPELSDTIFRMRQNLRM